MRDIVCIGDASLDLFIQADECHLLDSPRNPLLCFRHGDKINIDQLDYYLGGSAANTAVGLAKLGINTALLGMVGQDDTAEKVFASLEKQGVETGYLKKDRGIQTSFSIVIRKGGDRTILVYHGVKDYGNLAIPKNLSSKWIFISPLGKGYEDVYDKAVSLRATKGIKLALNLGATQIEVGAKHLSSILRVTDILFLNKMEAMDLVSWPNRVPRMQELAKSIMELGPKIVAITDGPKGACVAGEKLFISSLAYEAVKVDPTGAGDAFASGFLAGVIASEKEKVEDLREILQRSLKWGLINSAATITQLGAQNGILRLSEITKRANESHELTISSL